MNPNLTQVQEYYVFLCSIVIKYANYLIKTTTNKQKKPLLPI